MRCSTPIRRRLHLKAGEWVEVRSWEEILATLDETGRFENVPFMPEMLACCGRRFRVYKRADKTCDNTVGWSIRRLTDAVFLEGVRCDGSGHGGCAAGCLIFWKEAWLKRVDDGGSQSSPPASKHCYCTVGQIHACAQTCAADGRTVYSCQATDVRRFTSYLKIWDPRQYLRDLWSGNLLPRQSNGSGEQQLLEFMLAVLALMRALVIALFNEIQVRRQPHGRSYPTFTGTLPARTPVDQLDLQPGELVQVRDKEEILTTLDHNNCNRGLRFTAEMLEFCGGIYRVVRRVHHIVDERTGYMLDMKTPAIILEGVFCTAEFRRLCPRAIYHYWRECWLTRAVDSQAHAVQPAEKACTRECNGHEIVSCQEIVAPKA
jgi:hypothetical protein